MLKHGLLVLAAAGLLCVAGPFAGAQDKSPGQPPSAQPNGASGEYGGRRHGPPDPAKRTQMLTQKLNLTPEQQTKVQSLFQSERTQMESVHQDSSLSQADRRGKMMEIHKSTDDQVRALLDATQQQKWDQMQAKREQWMQNHHPGPPPSAGSDQQSAPPQP